MVGAVAYKTYLHLMLHRRDRAEVGTAKVSLVR